MGFRRAWCALYVAGALVLAGCASQEPVDLSADYFSAGKAKQGRVGVMLASLPKVDTQFPGASCLLCLVVANTAHSSLSKQVQSFSTAELKPLPSELVDLLKKQGIDALLIDEPLKVADLPDLNAADATNKTRKSFAALQKKHQLSRLLLVDIKALGVWRSYSAYVPTDVPKAVLSGSASLIDLSNHSLEWHLPLDLSRAAEGAWDEPPTFPGLTNAYFQVLESGMDAIKQPFKK